MIFSENEFTQSLGYMPEKYDYLYWETFEEKVNSKNDKAQSELQNLS